MGSGSSSNLYVLAWCKGKNYRYCIASDLFEWSVSSWIVKNTEPLADQPKLCWGAVPRPRPLTMQSRTLIAFWNSLQEWWPLPELILPVYARLQAGAQTWTQTWTLQRQCRLVLWSSSPQRAQTTIKLCGLWIQLRSNKDAKRPKAEVSFRTFSSAWAPWWIQHAWNSSHSKSKNMTSTWYVTTQPCQITKCLMHGNIPRDDRERLKSTHDKFEHCKSNISPSENSSQRRLGRKLWSENSRGWPHTQAEGTKLHNGCCYFHKNIARASMSSIM